MLTFHAFLLMSQPVVLRRLLKNSFASQGISTSRGRGEQIMNILKYLEERVSVTSPGKGSVYYPLRHPKMKPAAKLPVSGTPKFIMVGTTWLSITEEA